MKYPYRLILAVILLAACSNSQDYVQFSGKINNTDADSLQINGNGYSRSIDITREGSFKDTLQLGKGYYTMNIGSLETSIFLKNGYDLTMTADAEDFYKTLHFKGHGADNNNFIAERVAFLENEIGTPRQYFELDKEAFEQKVDTLRQQLQAMFEGRTLDSALVAKEQAINKRWINYLTSNYNQQHKLYSALEQGDPAHPFHNFARHGGGRISFEDLPREYIYIMVWSTTCEPCLKALPAFKKLKQQYSEQPITFIGISVDGEANDKEWEQMVAEKELGGIQLHSLNGLYRPFFRNYNITSPPRYILIDENRNIIDAFAPAPSNPELKELLKQVGG